MIFIDFPRIHYRAKLRGAELHEKIFDLLKQTLGVRLVIHWQAFRQLLEQFPLIRVSFVGMRTSM